MNRVETAPLSEPVTKRVNPLDTLTGAVIDYVNAQQGLLTRGL